MILNLVLEVMNIQMTLNSCSTYILVHRCHTRRNFKDPSHEINNTRHFIQLNNIKTVKSLGCLAPGRNTQK